jgi:putative ABC transport system substrate-binding protein
MMRLLRGLALVAAMLTTAAPAVGQPAGGTARLGYIFVGTVSGSSQNVEAFRDALRELGYAEGRNIALELRYADGRFERVPGILEELIRLKVDVIVVGGYQLILAANQATRTIPIVGVSCGVEMFAESLARPGGNVTGVACMSPDLAAKQLQILKEVLPRVTAVAVVHNPQAPYTLREVRDLEGAARTLGIRLHPVPVNQPEDFEPAFASLGRVGAQAVLTISDPLTYSQRKQIADLASRHRLPGMFGFRDYAQAGGLVSYGSNLQALVRRAAFYVDKILKGAKPGDIPVEQPTRFELVINLRTARALGVTIPQSLLLRADEVIQ